MSGLVNYNANKQVAFNPQDGESFVLPSELVKDQAYAWTVLDTGFQGASYGDACGIDQFDSEFEFNPGDEVAVNILKDTHSNWGFVQADDTYLNDFLPGGDFEFGLEVIGEDAGIMPGDVGQASGLACNRASNYQLSNEFAPYKDW